MQPPDPPDEDGPDADGADDEATGRWRPAVPTTVVLVSVLVALVAVSGLLVVLFQRTTGPGEVLRDFSRRLEADDCGGSYDLLAPSVRNVVPEDEWCGLVPALAADLDPRFTIGARSFHEGIATIEVGGEGTAPATWVLRRSDGSWAVLGVVAGPVDFPVPLPPEAGAP